MFHVYVALAKISMYKGGTSRGRVHGTATVRALALSQRERYARGRTRYILQQLGTKWVDWPTFEVRYGTPCQDLPTGYVHGSDERMQNTHVGTDDARALSVPSFKTHRVCTYRRGR